MTRLLAAMVASLVLFGAVAACTSTASSPASVSVASAPAAEIAAAPGYRLGPNDKIRVIVFGEEGLSGEFTVDAAGEVALPLIGEVKATGLTPREFEDAVAAAYQRGYVRDPKVSIEVLNYRPYYILGEVKTPGEYPYRNGLTVLGAIASAQGFTYRANTRTVFIDRPGEPERMKVAASVNVPILPGDVITVRERLF